jgi:hypothetical protein
MKVIFSQNLSSGQGVYFDVMIADPQPESTQASTLTKFMGADPQPSVLSIVDLGPGLVVFGCLALVALVVSTGVLTSRKPSSAS